MFNLLFSGCLSYENNEMCLFKSFFIYQVLHSSFISQELCFPKPSIPPRASSFLGWHLMCSEPTTFLGSWVIARKMKLSPSWHSSQASTVVGNCERTPKKVAWVPGLFTPCPSASWRMEGTESTHFIKNYLRVMQGHVLHKVGMKLCNFNSTLKMQISRILNTQLCQYRFRREFRAQQGAQDLGIGPCFLFWGDPYE